MTIWDPSRDEEAKAALVALNEARAERDAYERETRPEREAEAKEADADRIKQALAGDDPDAIREALREPETGRKRHQRGVRWSTAGGK